MSSRAHRMQGRIFKTKKKTRIIQIHERSIVLRRAQTSAVWCSECGDKQLMVRPDMAAALTCHNLGFIYELIDQGLIHTHEEEGFLLVCIGSIPRS